MAFVEMCDGCGKQVFEGDSWDVTVTARSRANGDRKWVKRVYHLDCISDAEVRAKIEEAAAGGDD